MFKFEMIELVHPNANSDILNFEKVNYIFGPNAKGKTLLFKIIDFMSGSSDSLLSGDVEGLENISEIIAKCKVSDGFIFLKRKNNNLYVKYSDSDNYEKVDINTYKNVIMSYFTTNDNEELNLYNEIYSEQLTYRGFSFLNFIDEVGIGDISNVFTRSHTAKHVFRIKDVINFLLNYETVLKKNNLEIEMRKIRTKIDEETKKNSDYYEAIKKIDKIFYKNGLNFTDDIQENYKTFLAFREEFGKYSAEPINFDLIKLLDISNRLSEQIRIQRQMNVQTTMIINRHKKVEKLIDDLSHIFTKDNLPYKEYIEELLQGYSEQDKILLAKNYNETVEKLKEEKKEVDDKIKLINSNLSITNLKNKILDISILEESFDLIQTKPFSLAYLETLKEKYSSLQSDLKKIKEDTKHSNSKTKIDKMITSCYREFGINSFIKHDLIKDNFSIIFNEDGLSICGSYTKDDTKKFYLPGSLARMTLWQICTYIAFIEYIIEYRKNLPLMPILCIDSLNQPFDEADSNYIETLNLLFKILTKRNIQIFIFSTKYNEKVESLLNDYSIKKVDLNDGLNSCH